MHRRNIFSLRAMFRYPRATHSLPGQTQLLPMRRSFDLAPSQTSHRGLIYAIARSIHRWFSTHCQTEPTSTALLGFTCPSQYCSCSRALGCYHRSSPTCRFAYPASTVFVEGSVAPPSHPLSQAADHGGSPRLLGRTREQSVPVDRVTSRQADAAMGFASCRFSGTLLAQHDFDPLFRLPSLYATVRATDSAIQRTTGDRVISLRKPSPAPIHSWVYDDFRNECDSSRHLISICSLLGAPNSSPALQRVEGLMPSRSDF